MVALPLLGRRFKLKSVNQENIPEKGSALIVSNHRSTIDPILVAAEITRPINFLAASYTFEVPIVRWMYENAGVLPLYLEGGKKNEPMYRKAINLLHKGEAVGIFPEGMGNFLNPFGGDKIKKFHTGFVRMSLATASPIIPLAIVGEGERYLNEWEWKLIRLFTPSEVYEGFRKALKIIIYKRVTIRVGEPIYLDDYYHQMYTKDLLNHIAGRVRREIIRLYNEGV